MKKIHVPGSPGFGVRKPPNEATSANPHEHDIQDELGVNYCSHLHLDEHFWFISQFLV